MNIEEISEKVLYEILTQSDERLLNALCEEKQSTHQKDNMVKIVSNVLSESRHFTVDYVNAMLNEILNGQKSD